jgi:predicted nucleic acid-binding protein
MPAIIAATVDLDLIGPSVIPWEMGNAFTIMFKRRKLSETEAVRAYRAFQGIPLRYVDADVKEAIRLVNRLGVSAYDACFLVCAETARAPLLSLDRALVAMARTHGIRMLEC